MSAASSLTRLHRDAQLRLRSSVVAELTELFPALRYDDLDGSFGPWAAAVELVVNRSRPESTALSLTYYQAHRLASGVPGLGTPIEADPLVAGLVRGKLELTARATIKRGAKNGTPPVKSMNNAFVLSSNSATRLVLEGGRESMMKSLSADPSARGYRRVVNPGACQFCSDIGAQTNTSAIFESGGAAAFPAHDGCGCTSAPVWGR